MQNNLTHMINGKLVKEENLFISAHDLGFLRGFAVFDFLVTYNNKPFLFDEHIERLLNSAKLINLEHPWKKDQIKKMVLTAIDNNPKDFEKTIKIVLSGGESTDGFTPENKAQLIILIDKRTRLPQETHQKGINLITSQYKRYLPESKTNEYVEAIKNINKMRAKNAFEILYYNNTQVFECSRSNIFAVINNKLITPKNNVLKGITRKVVLEKLKLPIVIIEQNFSLSDILKAKEVFITKSNDEILPVVKIDNKVIGNGRVGEITKLIMQEFSNFTKSESWSEK